MSERPSETNRIPGSSMQVSTESEQNLSIQGSGEGLFANAQNVLITGGVFNIFLPANTREEHTMKIPVLQKPNSSSSQSSSQDMTLGPDHGFTQESDDDHGSWPITTPAESLPIQWNSYANCVSPNEATQSSPNLIIMNSCSAPSLLPLYDSSRLGTLTPSNSDCNRPSFTYRQQFQLFREAVTLRSEGAGPFIPQPMYKPHTTSDRKRYAEDVLLEAPIYFFVGHSECGISLYDALHSRVGKLVNREEGGGVRGSWTLRFHPTRVARL